MTLCRAREFPWRVARLREGWGRRTSVERSFAAMPDVLVDAVGHLAQHGRQLAQQQWVAGGDVEAPALVAVHYHRAERAAELLKELLGVRAVLTRSVGHQSIPSACASRLQSRPAPARSRSSSA